MVRAFAPAKINLTLHVTGRRADGYHLLDSLVVFADVGDWVGVRPAPDLTLRVTGPMARGVPAGDSNLVLRAARAMGTAGAAFELEKHLPAAAGIGGGSSDAAAAMRAISDLSGAALPGDRGLSLGADVPACLSARSCRMRGIGERVTEVAIPPVQLVLVNPGVSVSTAAVFGALDETENAPMPDPLPRWTDARDLAGWLAGMRNDLEPPARAAAPEIDRTLDALDTTGALIARMSGSGATCFAIYTDAATAETACAAVARAHPDWWCVAARA